MANLGTAVSLLLPADAVWRGASFNVLPTSFLVAGSFANGEEIGRAVRVDRPHSPGHARLGGRLPGGLPRPGRGRVPPPTSEGGVWTTGATPSSWATLPVGARDQVVVPAPRSRLRAGS